MTSKSHQRSTNTIRLELPATLQYLSILGACLNDILGQVRGLGEQEVVSYNVQLAVQELCTNIVRHAYEEAKPEERIYITITLYVHPRRLSVELLDNGKFFDESLVQEPDLEDSQIHGYGLFIIKSLMDEVTYTRQGQHNCWYLMKNLEEKS
jgi:serine/threonine-protein kinase RsbW